jgi:hypothetical protein
MVSGEETACICPILAGMSTIAVFYQSAASDPCTGLAGRQAAYPKYRGHDVRQLIYIVARMLLISSVYQTAGWKIGGEWYRL